MDRFHWLCHYWPSYLEYLKNKIIKTYCSDTHVLYCEVNASKGVGKYLNLQITDLDPSLCSDSQWCSSLKLQLGAKLMSPLYPSDLLGGRKQHTYPWALQALDLFPEQEWKRSKWADWFSVWSVLKIIWICLKDAMIQNLRLHLTFTKASNKRASVH